MSDEQDFEPQEAARTILERLRDGGLWQPAGLGLSYIRTGEKTVTLSVQENTPQAAQARIRMRMLVESIGWTIDESEVTLVDVESRSPQEQHMQEMMLRQEVAQQWKCKCGTPLVAFPLEEGVWTFDGQEELLLPNGETEMAEQWSVVITCPVCEERIPCEPYDYGLLAGDDAMLTYRTPHMVYEALDRGTIVNRVDEKETSHMMVLGTFCPMNGDLLPPHVRGSVVWATPRTEEEE